MKKYYALSLAVALAMGSNGQQSTSLPITAQRDHGGTRHPASPGTMVQVDIPHAECMDEEGYAELFERIALNKELHGIAPPSDADRGAQPFFIWPVRPRADFTGYGYYTNNFFVDHNATVNGNLLDWNCQQRTYDWASGNHMGTDMILWPYAWRRMAEEVMEIVAAAPGTIVDKRDGYFDQQCANVGQTTWNGIVIEHADGSKAIYMHFKNGGITTKQIGETVAEGEFLGLAGSSGSSNWPHLHFEVRTASNAPIDPFAGPCNSFNGTQTWWQQQQQWSEPRINHLSTHSSSIEFYQCPVPEITYEQGNFMAGDSLILRIYYRDLANNALTNLVIRDAQGNAVASWDFYSPWLFGATTWAWWYYVIDNSWATGAYTFEATFNGQLYVHPFTVGMPIGMPEADAFGFSLAPNPSDGVVRLDGLPATGARLSVIDATGRMVHSAATQGSTYSFDAAGLGQGAYQVLIGSDALITSRRLVIAR